MIIFWQKFVSINKSCQRSYSIQAICFACIACSAYRDSSLSALANLTTSMAPSVRFEPILDIHRRLEDNFSNLTVLLLSPLGSWASAWYILWSEVSMTFWGDPKAPFPALLLSSCDLRAKKIAQPREKWHQQGQGRSVCKAITNQNAMFPAAILPGGSLHEFLPDEAYAELFQLLILEEERCNRFSCLFSSNMAFSSCATLSQLQMHQHEFQ